jgi:hypothetical protein
MSYNTLPAVYKYWLVSSSPLNLCYLFYHIHYTPQVGALPIWYPAGDVELGHSVGPLSLKIERLKQANIQLHSTCLFKTLSVLMVNPSRSSSLIRSTV